MPSGDLWTGALPVPELRVWPRTRVPLSAQVTVVVARRLPALSAVLPARAKAVCYPSAKAVPVVRGSEERGAIVIDQIAMGLHPVDQGSVLADLRSRFPRSQIICSTYSPLVLQGLGREITNLDAPFTRYDARCMGMGDILREIMGLGPASMNQEGK